MSLPIKYGIILFGVLSAVFFISFSLGQADNSWLRWINWVIYAIVIYIGIRKYRAENPESYGNYLSGVGTGMYITTIGSLLYALTVGLTLHNNGGLQESISNQFPVAFTPDGLSAAILIFVEGIVVGLIGSYIMTRVINAKILKNKTGEPDVNEDYDKNAGTSKTTR